MRASGNPQRPSLTGTVPTNGNGKNLVAEGSIYMTLDSVANAGLGGVFWIVMAKIAAPEIVGSAVIVVALTSILVVFAGLGFHLGASKFISEYNSVGLHKISRLVYSRTIQVTVASALTIASVLVLASSFLANDVYGDQQLVILIAVGALSLPFQALVRSLNGVYQGCHRMAFCLIGDLTFLVLRLGIAVFLVLGGFGALGILLGYVVGFLTSAFIGIAVLAPAALPRIGKAEDSNLFNRMFRFSAPNYLATIFHTGAGQVSILLVGLFLDVTAAAYYNIASLTRLVLVTLTTSIGLALLPTVSTVSSGGSRESISGLYNLSVRSAILLASAPVLVFFLVPERILALLSPEYSQASAGLQILVLSSLGATVFAISIAVLNGLNRPFKALLAAGTGATLGIALSAVMIPIWGLSGAAAGLLVDGIIGASVAVTALSLREGVRLRVASLVVPLLALAGAIGFGELLLFLGVHGYITVPLALVALLGLSLALRVLTLSELWSTVRLAVEKVRPDRLAGSVG